MYNLGVQFKFDPSTLISNPKAIFHGKNFRITILSEILVRLEYNITGTFEDRATEQVWNRNFEMPNISVKQDEKFLEITTKYFKLKYEKEKPFTGTKFNQMAHLSIELLNTDRIWYFNHPEARTLEAPLYIEDDKVKYGKSLYSLDGFVSIDDAKGFVFDEGGILKQREGDFIDTYVFLYHKNFELCLKNFYKLTGKPPLLPRYALGNWWSRNVPYNDNSLSELINSFEKNEIPISAILLNHDWHIRSYNKKEQLETGFTFNSNHFKSLLDTILKLHNHRIHIGLTINPLEGIYPFETYYEKATEYLEAKSDGVIPFNVLDPSIIDVYLKMLIHPLESIRTDFYCIDGTIKNKRDLWILNHYHYKDGKRNIQNRPLIVSQNTEVMAHRYSVLYAGKSIVGWDTLKKIPFYNSSATNIGINYWCHDIGGFYKGTEDNELYTRFVQLGTFSPILKFGAEKGKFYKREPWRWSVKTNEIVKKYLNLRHRLIPYIYTEMYEYVQNTKPIIVPIYYTFPQLYDDELYKNEYYFGSQLFISPILSKKDYVMDRVIHKIFIPEGTWYDFMTGKKFPGGKRYVAFFKDDEYPVFAKAGSIIPLAHLDHINDTNVPKNLEIQIFPGKNNSYTLYEDDGNTNLYEKGFYIKTNIDYNYLKNNYTVIVRAIEGKTGIIPDTRNYIFRFRNTKESTHVSVYYQDTEIPFECYVDGPDFIVKVANVKTVGQLTINCRGKDIEIDAVRIINDEIESIISDVQVETEIKEKIDTIMFSDLPIKKKRIEIRKLGNHGLDQKFVRLFLKLLEYVSAV